MEDRINVVYLFGIAATASADRMDCGCLMLFVMRPGCP